MQPILEWLTEHAEVGSRDRLFIRCMDNLFAEGIFTPDAISDGTVVSESCLAALRKVAEELVGKPFPHGRGEEESR
ncbi:MAG TPA: hypothetical protein ENJ09_04955 [Planctomycetes bacterium]|nr:hypothetical protein [Planctomycetota bacterium]